MNKIIKTPNALLGVFLCRFVIFASMYFIYNIIALGIQIFLSIVALFNKKMSLFIDGRKESFKKIEDVISSDDKTIWVHAASLGEFEQGRPIIERLREKFSNHKIVLTFFSPSGYEVQKNFKEADVICYLPLDSRSNARKFIKTVHPEIAIFVKYEFWPNLLRELERKNIETILVSGIFRKEQVFFKWFGSWMRQSLQSFSYFFVQNENSKQLLNTIGFDNVAVSGDTRFDRVYSIKEQNSQLDFMINFKQDKTIFVAGSSWKEDESIIVDYINGSEQDYAKFVIAPHNINTDEIKKLKESIHKETVLYSELGNSAIEDANVMIIDTIGLLTKIYKYADVAYVGGAFATGLHNVLEPAAFGSAIIIGPNYNKFNEAVELVKLGGCMPVQNYTEFKEILNSLLSDPVLRTKKGKIAGDYIVNNTGATKMVFKYVINKIAL
jgi:3-deoxy-D-manno-octulosonic-acid transferase